ncbi:alginate lyase-domain-containing protein, partial [Hyaloraphidium curvatum]
MRRPDAALPLLLSSLALLLCTPAALAQAPRLFLQQPSDLAINARAAARGVEPFPSVLRWLAADAETAYAAPVVSVGDGKHRPEGWQRGDYVSLSPYWWPDWSKPNGLPYFRRDGLINPEVAEYTDKGKLVVNVLDYTVSLGYAHYFARTSPGAFPRPAEAYARKAVAQLKAWFVNPQTRMNPNMKFAQIRPGLPASATDGATGILDLSREIRFVEALALLANNTRLFDRELATGLRSWFSDMLTWLETSRPGRKAATSGNNLGIYYDGLIGILKLYLGRSDAATYIRNACQSRLDVHVRPSGEMPAETSRSDSLHYTIFALKGLLKLAMLSDRVTPN